MARIHDREKTIRGAHGTSAKRTGTRPREDSAHASLPQTVTVGCAALETAQPQALGATYWFDSAKIGDTARPVTVRFTGRRVGVQGRPGPTDSFVQFERIDKVEPGFGRICVTTRVRDIHPGEWRITARSRQ